MALSDRQYRAVLDLVGEVHDAQDLPELRSVTIPSLRRLVPAEYCSYNEIPSGRGEFVAIAEPELPAFAHEAWERHASTNPIVAHYARTRDGRPYRFSDLVTQDELRRTPIYRELYRPLGVEHQIAFILPSPVTLMIGVALSRDRKRDFGDDERIMLDLIRPHMIQAYRNAQLRQRLAGVLDLLTRGLDSHGAAALLVEPAGTLLFATREGAELAAQVAGGELVQGRLLPPQLAAFLDQRGPAGWVRLHGGDSVLVHRVLAEDGSAVLFLDRAARVLTPEALEGLGLTPREAGVLAGLARGHSTAEVAEALGVRPRTVDKHAERIHRKLGVRDRAQAVATAWAATEAGTG